MENNHTLMEFPCDFNIKIIGTNNDLFTSEILTIARNYFPNTTETSIRSQVSKQNNYQAITLTVHVHDQATLDSLYNELTKHPDIKMVL